MSIPLQTIVFCFPAVIVFIVRRRQGLSWSEARRELGWKGTSLRYLGLGLLLGLIPGVILLPGVELIPSEVMDDPNIANARYVGWAATPTSFLLALAYEAFYVALGEEVLFRGLIGGVLFRRLGFAIRMWRPLKRWREITASPIPIPTWLPCWTPKSPMRCMSLPRRRRTQRMRNWRRSAAAMCT